jgi:hypothetical protein
MRALQDTDLVELHDAMLAAVRERDECQRKSAKEYIREIVNQVGTAPNSEIHQLRREVDAIVAYLDRAEAKL